MSIVSIPLPENVGLYVSEQPVESPAPEQSAGELSGYGKSMSKSDAVEKFATQSRKSPKPNLVVPGFTYLFKF